MEKKYLLTVNCIKKFITFAPNLKRVGKCGENWYAIY